MYIVGWWSWGRRCTILQIDKIGNLTFIDDVNSLYEIIVQTYFYTFAQVHVHVCKHVHIKLGLPTCIMCMLYMYNSTPVLLFTHNVSLHTNV